MSKYLSDIPKIYLDGTDSSLYNFCIRERPEIPSPDQQSSGTNNPLSFRGDPKTTTGYSNVKLAVAFNYLEMVDEVNKSFRMAFAEFRGILFNTKIIQFNDDVDAYYKVRNVQISSAKNEFIEYGDFVVTFECAPFAYLNDDENGIEQVLEKKNTISMIMESNMLLSNDSYYTAYPSIRVKMSEAVFSTTGDRNFELSIAPVRPDGSYTNFTNEMIWRIGFNPIPINYDLIIDSENTLMYLINAETNFTLAIGQYIKDIYIGDFPEIPVGEFTLGINQSAIAVADIKVPVVVERNRVI